MYDKYNKVTPFTQNSDLPKHKGVLLSNTTSGSIFFHANSALGGTVLGGLSFSGPGFHVLPIELARVTQLTGTGYLLN